MSIYHSVYSSLISVQIIPRAIDYFTGKALEYEDAFDDEDDFEDIDEDEDEDDDRFDDVSPYVVIHS